MSFYDFRSNPDRQLLKHPLLRGKRMLGKGMMGGTFECDEHSVYKITCDVAQYRFLTELCDGTHPFFPVCFDALGPMNDESYLVRVERLSLCIRPATGIARKPSRIRPPSGRDAFIQSVNQEANALAAERERLTGVPDHVVRMTEPWEFEAQCLRRVARLSEFFNIAPALQALAGFIDANGYRLDIKVNNFMMRGESLVFNDPVSQLFRRTHPDANDEFRAG